MSRLLVAVLGAVLMVAAGCESSGNKKDGDAKMMSADACPMCEGVQKANAEGKCDMCEAKKSNMSKMGAGAAGADACPHCAGVQTATADGKCPKCGMAMAK